MICEINGERMHESVSDYDDFMSIQKSKMFLTVKTSKTNLQLVSTEQQEIQKAWQEKDQNHPLLKRLLLHARAKDYGNLHADFEGLHGVAAFRTPLFHSGVQSCSAVGQHPTRYGHF